MLFSTLGKNGVNFDNLSIEGYASFILGIIFSIVTIACVIYYLKHQDSNKLIKILATLVFPVISVFCWMYLIMNVTGYPLDISIYASLGAAAGYVALAFLVAFIVIAIEKANEKAGKKEKKPEQKAVEEPLLLTSSEVEEKTEEDVEAVEEVTDETENTNEEVEVEEFEVEEPEQGVVFANTEKKPFTEQLEELDDDRKAYFNEILEYAMSMPRTKRADSKYHATVKIGRQRLLDSKFAKGNLICNFMAGSSELKNYSQSEKNVKIKEKPVALEINSAESVVAAKKMIDIAYKNIADAHEEKREAKQAIKRQKKAEAEGINLEETTTNIEETPVEEAPKKRRGRKKKSETIAPAPVEEVPAEETPKKRRGRKKKSETQNNTSENE